MTGDPQSEAIRSEIDSAFRSLGLTEQESAYLAMFDEAHATPGHDSTANREKRQRFLEESGDKIRGDLGEMRVRAIVMRAWNSFDLGNPETSIEYLEDAIVYAVDIGDESLSEEIFNLKRSIEQLVV